MDFGGLDFLWIKYWVFYEEYLEGLVRVSRVRNNISIGKKWFVLILV